MKLKRALAPGKTESSPPEAVPTETTQPAVPDEPALLALLARQSAEQTACMQKQLRYMRVCMAACVGLALALLAVCLLLVPKAHTALDDVAGITGHVSAFDWDGLSDSLDDLTGITEEVSKIDWVALTDNIDELVTTSRQSVLQAARTLTDIDLETLNGAIADLKRVVEPLAKLFK